MGEGGQAFESDGPPARCSTAGAKFGTCSRLRSRVDLEKPVTWGMSPLIRVAALLPRPVCQRPPAWPQLHHSLPLSSPPPVLHTARCSEHLRRRSRAMRSPEMVRIRTSHTWTGLTHFIAAFLLKMRRETLACPPTAGPQQVQEKIGLAKEIAAVLLRNVVQAVQLDEPARGAHDYQRFSKSAEANSSQRVLITPRIRAEHH